VRREFEPERCKDPTLNVLDIVELAGNRQIYIHGASRKNSVYQFKGIAAFKHKMLKQHLV
jgi:hypothetical protein